MRIFRTKSECGGPGRKFRLWSLFEDETLEVLLFAGYGEKRVTYLQSTQCSSANTCAARPASARSVRGLQRRRNTGTRRPPFPSSSEPWPPSYPPCVTCINCWAGCVARATSIFFSAPFWTNPILGSVSLRYGCPPLGGGGGYPSVEES